MPSQYGRPLGALLTCLCTVLLLVLMGSHSVWVTASDDGSAKVAVIPSQNSEPGKTVISPLTPSIVDEHAPTGGTRVRDNTSDVASDAVSYATMTEGDLTASLANDSAASDGTVKVEDTSSRVIRLFRRRWGHDPAAESPKPSFPQDIAQITADDLSDTQTVFSLDSQEHISSSSLPESQAKQVRVPLVYQLLAAPAAAPLCQIDQCNGWFVSCLVAASVCDTFIGVHSAVVSASLPNFAYIEQMPKTEVLVWLIMLTVFAFASHMVLLFWNRLRHGPLLPLPAPFITVTRGGPIVMTSEMPGMPVPPRRRRLPLFRRKRPVSSTDPFDHEVRKATSVVFREELPWD